MREHHDQDMSLPLVWIFRHGNCSEGCARKGGTLGLGAGWKLFSGTQPHQCHHLACRAKGRSKYLVFEHQYDGGCAD